MATITVHCPICHNVIQFGKTRQGKQRYRCRNEKCEKNTFIFNYTYKGHQQEIKEKIIDMALNASGIRDTARVLKISMNTVMATLKKSRSIRKRQSKNFRTRILFKPTVQATLFLLNEYLILAYDHDEQKQSMLQEY